ncbi:hypothetical protein NM208_g13980 [Fusarium decemcellulare]|uniref:Uncharacterized protein n=1 Tax=Fusarium decemcellulare TaxID=57161 RepID=A0ACC1RLZ2_9HYPO|nr:hypothetical protein NM208_g13980 [Fusarium decemcellulare]
MLQRRSRTPGPNQVEELPRASDVAAELSIRLCTVPSTRNPPRRSIDDVVLIRREEVPTGQADSHLARLIRLLETWALAERLRDHGVGRDDLVGVLMGRSAEYVIASLAALRAGGAFLVLEVAYPPGLLRDVIEDAKPTVILTQVEHAGHIRSDVPVIVVDHPDKEARGETSPHLDERRSLPEDDDVERLAFVSYSSGTTGQPKGIMNPHRAAVRSYDLRFGVSDLKPGDRVACNVFFIWEMLRPLLRGATTVAIPDHASYDPVALVELLSSWRITDTLMTPTLLATVLSRHPKLGEPSSSPSLALA